MESEQERLTRMYGEMSDEHLRNLAGDPDSLTPTAEMALRHALVARGLAANPVADAESAAEPGDEFEQGFTPGIPGMFPSSAAGMESALEPGGDVVKGMQLLITFFDGHELTRACEILEADDIDLVLEPADRDALSGAPPSFGIRVATADYQPAIALLREKMGLFPRQEVASLTTVDTLAEGEEAPALLGSFETVAEAEKVRTMLENAGIASTTAPDDGDDPETWHNVHVSAVDLERGLTVVSDGLALS